MGSNGAASDAQIFADSKLKEAMENDVIDFPPSNSLPNDDRDTPYFVIYLLISFHLLLYNVSLVKSNMIYTTNIGK